MAKDDYHVIVYQILSYLYVQLKAGEPIEPDKISCDTKNYGINEKYWKYIIYNLTKDDYITGLTVEIKHWVSGDELIIKDLGMCQITPRGIDYLTDNSFMKKVRALFNNITTIAPLIEAVIK